MKKMKINLAQLEPIDNLDEEERLLHQAMRQGHFTFQGDAKTISHYAEIFKTNAKQRKMISLRIPTQDYFAIKTKASHLGLPYQALINSLIHCYVNEDRAR